MTTRRGFFGMLAGLAALPLLPKQAKGLEGRKLDLKFSGTSQPYYYTTFLVGADALVFSDAGLPSTTYWVWNYDQQKYIPRRTKP